GRVEVVKILLPQPLSNLARLHARKLAEETKHSEALAEFDRWWARALFEATERQSPEQLSALKDLLAWDHTRLSATTRPSDGLSPLRVALAASNPGLELIDLLCQSDRTGINAADSSGETPLYFAVRAGKSRDVIDHLASWADRAQMNATDSRGQRLLN